MMIENKTKGTVVCRTHELADSSWSRTRGLMFRKDLPREHGLLMTFPGGSRPGIWMLGMRFPIDILFLDSEKRVIKIVGDVRPLGLSWRTWRIYSPGRPASFVLELAAGKARESGTSLGDRLVFG
jgi:uncharacterized membrane protein (UPF0127 family)